MKKDLTIEEYRDLMAGSPICTIDLIFLDENKKNILLGKRNNKPYKGIFYTFGGRLSKNEDFLEVAKRIGKGETGLELDQNKLRFIGVINENNDHSIFDDINYHAVTLCFEYVLDKEAKLTLDSQHSECAWIATDDPGLHPNIKTRIEMALGDKPTLK